MKNEKLCRWKGINNCVVGCLKMVCKLNEMVSIRIC